MVRINLYLTFQPYHFNPGNESKKHTNKQNKQNDNHQTNAQTNNQTQVYKFADFADKICKVLPILK